MLNTKKIEDRLKDHGIKKSQLIKDSGLTRVTIDKILKGGDINVSTLEALAKGLGVNIGFFFDENDNIHQFQLGDGTQQEAGRDANNGINQTEHDELIKIREEVKFLKLQISEKNKEINSLKKYNERLQNYLMENK